MNHAIAAALSDGFSQKKFMWVSAESSGYILFEQDYSMKTLNGTRMKCATESIVLNENYPANKFNFPDAPPKLKTRVCRERNPSNISEILVISTKPHYIARDAVQKIDWYLSKTGTWCYRQRINIVTGLNTTSRKSVTDSAKVCYMMMKKDRSFVLVIPTDSPDITR